jgi:hypothetical protein
MNNKREDTLNKVFPFTPIIIGIIILIPSFILACFVVFGEIENYYIFIIKILLFLCLIGFGGYLIIKGITLAYSGKKAGDDDCGGKDAKNTKDKLPSWFTHCCLPKDISFKDTALLQYLNTCRQVIYPAASLYHDHIKYVSTVLVALLTAMIAIFSFLKIAGVTPGFVRNIELAGAGLMGVAFLIGVFSLYIIMRYHLLYIATLLYATEVHYAAGIIGFRWFEDMIELLGEEYKKNEKISREEFIRSRSWGRKYGHFWYCILIGVLISVCLAAGILLLFCAPFSSCYSL